MSNDPNHTHRRTYTRDEFLTLYGDFLSDEVRAHIEAADPDARIALEEKITRTPANNTSPSGALAQYLNLKTELLSPELDELETYLNTDQRKEAIKQAAQTLNLARYRKRSVPLPGILLATYIAILILIPALFPLTNSLNWALNIAFALTTITLWANIYLSFRFKSQHLVDFRYLHTLNRQLKSLTKHYKHMRSLDTEGDSQKSIHAMNTYHDQHIKPRINDIMDTHIQRVGNIVVHHIL